MPSICGVTIFLDMIVILSSILGQRAHKTSVEQITNRLLWDGWSAYGRSVKRTILFFEKVCKEAFNIYSATAGKSKLSATGSGSADKHSDLEIEERVGIMSDDSDDLDEGTSNGAKGMWNPSCDDMPDADGLR